MIFDTKFVSKISTEFTFSSLGEKVAAARMLAALTLEERLVEEGREDNVVGAGSSLGCRTRMRSLLSPLAGVGSRDVPFTSPGIAD